MQEAATARGGGPAGLSGRRIDCAVQAIHEALNLRPRLFGTPNFRATLSADAIGIATRAAACHCAQYFQNPLQLP
jgi:hypothetical protein